MQKIRNISLLLAITFFINACNTVQQAPTEVATLIPATVPATFTSLPEPSATSTATVTLTPSSTPSPSVSPTPSITPTPTFDFPDAVVNKQAHCRYGPSTAYLHAADLYPGDTGEVRERALYSNWLRIKFEKLSYFCWVAPSVVDVTGDVSTLIRTEPNLLEVGSNQYGPPHNVTAVRKGKKVTITWDQMKMTKDKDRGYFIEAWVCQNEAYLWWTVSFEDQYTTSYTVLDEPGCGEKSYGEIRTVEKHGYSKPAKIPWP